MHFSEYQEKIFEEISKGDKNIVVQAVAGSGKTTTLLYALDFIEKSDEICFLSFNKSIAEELKKKVPASVNVSTFHSLGWAAVRNKFKNAVLDDKKVYNHIQTFFDEKGIKERDFGKRVKISNNIRKLVDLLRTNLNIKPKYIDICSLAVDYGIEEVDNEFKHVPPILKKVTKDRKIFDFVDMLFVPVYLNLPFWQHDWVFIDELQDLNKIQQEIAIRSVRTGTGRFLAVGDKNQAIYGHLGADSAAFDNFVKKPNTVKLPLSICYRCGDEIILHAKKIVPEIEYWDGRGKGTVIENGSVNNIRDGDMVLCRTNAPLASLAAKFLKENRKVFIRGSDIGKNVVKMIERENVVDLVSLWAALNRRLRKIEEKLLKENDHISPKNQREYINFAEKVQVLEALSNNCMSCNDLAKKIEGIFSDKLDSTGIMLSTVHKAKGLQSENVFIIEPQLIPFPYYLHLPGERESENNVDYVARTRAIKKLEYVKDWTTFEGK